MSECLAQAKTALEKRANLVAELRSVNDDKNLTDADRAKRFEELDSEIRAIEDHAASLVDQYEREKRFEALTGKIATLAAPTQAVEARDEPTLDEQFRSVAVGESRGFFIPFSTDLPSELRIATVGNAANAGTTVERTFQNEVFQSLRNNSPFLSSGVRVVSTESGEEIVWPVKNGRLIAYLLAENTAYTKSDMSFSRTSAYAFKYGVMAEASAELLQDSRLAIASLVAEDMGEALADKTAADFLIGDGVNKPRGLAPAITLGLTGASIAGTFDTANGFDNVQKLRHAIIEKYRGRATWYCSDDVVLKLRLIKDTTGNYIWQDAVTADVQPMLFGRPVVTDPNMPNANAASKKVLLFGDFSKYFVRIAKGVSVSRSDEYGFDRDVIAWKANTRVDGFLADGASFAALSTPAT